MTINRDNLKPIAICLDNEGLRLFMTALLTEWGFTVKTYSSTDSGAINPYELILADENCKNCSEHQKRVELLSSAYIDNDHVNLPINPEQLWRVLERHYHRPPRHHLRLTVDYQVTMEIRGQQQAGCLDSLSPAGARLSLPREMALGEIIPIIFPLPGQTLHLLGKIIYVTTFPDSNNRYDAGVLFERISSEERALLRDTILKTFFTHIRDKIPGWAFEVGIGYFDLSPELRDQL